MAAWEAKRTFTQENILSDQSNWTSIGPFDYTQANAQPAGMGRINNMVVDPNNANTWYIGSPGGGVWKTTNAGTTWTPLSDNLPRVGVSAIAVDYNNSNTIYIATGDDDVQDSSWTAGVFKSTNGGITWSLTGLDVNLLGNVAHLSEIFIDPSNSNKIICSGSSGVFTSTDAGVTWSQTLAGINIRDMRLKPGDAQTVYVVSQSEFYRSIDGGVSFTQITSGVPTNTNRMTIDVTPANPNYVYIFSQSATSLWEHGIFRSNNSGQTFSTRDIDTNRLIGNQQVDYNMAIGVSDTNAEELYVGTLDLYRSTDGGSSWFKLNRWDQLTPTYTHADIHSLRSYNGRMFCTSDGGIYSSVDNGSSFQDHSAGLQIGEFFNVAVAQGNANNISGGLQDNGGFGLGVNGDWRGYHPGDGINTVISATDDNTYYGFIQGGQRLYISNQADGFITYVTKPSNAGTGVWVTPLASDSNGDIFAAWDNLFKLNRTTNTWDLVGALPGYTDILEIAPSDPMRVVSSGHQNLRVSTDGGATYDFDTNVVGNSIAGIAIHNTNPDIMWITTDGDYANKGIFKTIDGGYNWMDITANFPVATEYPEEVVFQGNDPLNPIYVSTDLGVYRLDDSSPNWQPFMNNLPNANITDLEINLADQSITASSYGRGLWRSSIDGLGGVSGIPPAASFTSVTETCPDQTVVLTDTSTNVPTAWQWAFSPTTVTFQNGTDATSQNPEVSFDGSGVYQITLTASNADGSNFISNPITVYGIASVPLFETFATTVPPVGWSVVNPDGLTTWEAVIVTGIGNNPTQVARIDNYSYNAAGQKDELVMPVVDLTTMINPVLKFEVAYAPYDDAFFERLQIEYSTDCGATFNLTTYDKAGSVLETHPASTSGWGPTDGTHWRTETIELSNYSSANTMLKFVHTNGYGNGMFIDDVRIEEGPYVAISPKVVLQGAAIDPSTGEETLMRDDLRVAGLLPTTSPYADGLMCNSSVFNKGGTSGIGIVGDDIVDWVFVELRDATTNTSIKASQSALLQRDGDVVGIDGTSNLILKTPPKNYYVTIKHRNHLSIMSSSTIILSETTSIVDFTNSASTITFGANAQTTFGMQTGIVAMWTGNANGDTVIQYSGTTPDTPSILSKVLNDPLNFLNFPTYIVNGYNTQDVNMDGKAQYSGTSPDTPFILQNVIAHPGNFLNFSTYSIQEQLPEN